jgi:uncharacterized protein YkwD
MKQLKSSPGHLFAVAFLTAAGLLATAAPGLAAEINPVPPLAAAGTTPPAAPADRHPNDGEDPTGDAPTGGWSGGGAGDSSDLSDGDDDGGADDSTVTGAHKPRKASARQTAAEKAAAKKAAAKAKKLQQAADKKAAKAKKSSAKNKKKKAAARKQAERAAAKRMEQQAHKAARDAARRSAVADDDGGNGRSGGGTSLDSVRREILDLTNRARRQAGCGALRYSTQLEKSAQWMANDMSDKHYMSHTAKNGRDFDQRIRGTGFNGDKTGENLGEGFDSAEGVFRAWMNSPSHRRNILDCKFKILGVGFNPDGGYWAQHFGG